MKTNPFDYLSEEEIYLQNFWNPSIGHQVVYENKIYKIKDILNEQAILEDLPDKIIWIQDLGWKPTLDDCDTIASRYNAQILTEHNQILFKDSNGNKSFFERPTNLKDYQNIIRQLRVFNNFHEVH